MIIVHSIQEVMFNEQDKEKPILLCWVYSLRPVYYTAYFLSLLREDLLAILHCTYLLRNIEFTSSCLMVGFFELAAMRRGRRKQVTKVDNCWLYSSSHSTILENNHITLVNMCLNNLLYFIIVLKNGLYFVSVSPIYFTLSVSHQFTLLCPCPHQFTLYVFLQFTFL